MSDAIVTALIVYPVKSMRGIPLDSATLTERGLQHDRQFMVVRQDGRFLTQREEPGLARIETGLLEAGIRLSLPARESIDVPFRERGGERVRARVWRDDCEALDAGRIVGDWLTEVLESSEPLRLVQLAPGFRRPQSQPEKLGRNTTTAFADAAPLLLACEESLTALNAELEQRGLQPVPMDRFRPNIVVRGLEAFAEHALKALAAAEYRLRMCHPCQRCVVTTIDQHSGLRHPDWEPYRTLRDLNPMPGKPSAPAFGQNAVVAAGIGRRIRSGDRLRQVS
jgi:uncharacterized protein YcbX